MNRRRVLFLAIPLLIAAIAANVPHAWLFGQTERERASEVISAFINLGSDPPPSPIKADWLVRNERLRLLRERRLVHVPPELIALYAEAEGITEAALRTRLIDPLRPDPFETAAAPLQLPEAPPHGQGGGKSWAFLSSGEADTEALEVPGCGLWVVIWDRESWVYAPVGMPLNEELLRVAFPAFGPALVAGAPRC